LVGLFCGSFVAVKELFVEFYPLLKKMQFLEFNWKKCLKVKSEENIIVGKQEFLDTRGTSLAKEETQH
jgi:hypothetical protein